MSNSYRKTAICGNCICDSEKSYKVIAHRKERKAIHSILQKAKYNYFLDENIYELNDNIQFPVKNEISDIWDFGKDGKQNFTRLKKEDPECYKKLIRK